MILDNQFDLEKYFKQKNSQTVRLVEGVSWKQGAAVEVQEIASRSSREQKVGERANKSSYIQLLGLLRN